MSALRAFLQNAPSIKHVWVDWSCMPQGERSSSEQQEFKRMLPEINLVYLTATVLILMDMTYMSRFWTQFEAWLSLQMATADGLRCAARDVQRCSFRGVLNGKAVEAELQAALLKQWEGKSPEDAHEILSQEDVTVTNESDKSEQLPKLQRLNRLVKAAIAKVPIEQLPAEERARRLADEEARAKSAETRHNAVVVLQRKALPVPTCRPPPCRLKTY